MFLRTTAVILFAAIVAFTSRWWWVGGGALALMYIGAIGAKLHPSLSAREGIAAMTAAAPTAIRN